MRFFGLVFVLFATVGCSTTIRLERTQAERGAERTLGPAAAATLVADDGEVVFDEIVDGRSIILSVNHISGGQICVRFIEDGVRSASGHCVPLNDTLFEPYVFIQDSPNISDALIECRTLDGSTATCRPSSRN